MVGVNKQRKVDGEVDPTVIHSNPCLALLLLYHRLSFHMCAYGLDWSRLLSRVCVCSNGTFVYGY